MFIVTAKFSKKKALIIVLILAMLLTAIILFAGRRDQGSQVQDIPIENPEDVVTFLETLGWEVNPTPLEMQEVVIPREFNEVFEQYNDMQIEHGFDLRDFRGMAAVRHTYQITNYPGQTEGVVADVLVSEGRVIGGNIQSFTVDGFIHGLSENLTE